MFHPDSEETDFFLPNQDNATKEPWFVYWIYFIYGLVMLLPWNVFITASGYFSIRFSGTDYQQSFPNYFSAFFNCSNLACLAILLWRQSKRWDVWIPICVNAMIFLFFVITSVVPTFASPIVYFWITSSLLILTGITTSLLQISVVEQASQLLPKYMQAVMSGQGIAGVFVSLLLVATDQSSWHDFLYFLVAFLVACMSLFGRIIMPTLQPPLDVVPMTSLDSPRTGNPTIFRRSNVYIGTIVYVYWITLSLFPSVTLSISPTHMDKALFTSLHFLLFNIGDWIGRTLPIWPVCQIMSSQSQWWLAFARTLFVPLFLILRHNHASDWLFFVCLLLFSISNGWLTTLVFMAAPTKVEMSCRPMVSRYVSFFLVVGLALGGLSSFVY
ncbi:nucleoside transporter-domain-containing protein [Gilbertella persicaria]|uniref:nucleoside transporter-domain-containing protein n=1 Tax=Gilbertella persicaria TaxID=101096 RepID=UPI00221E58B9|nr:nucleoside transporter-domain-containing protein [Gilbertella persicaria]KAI8073436.1 nucleoside transporter-domain-containing protein [Gilbertella persicaria]